MVHPVSWGTQTKLRSGRSQTELGKNVGSRERQVTWIVNLGPRHFTSTGESDVDAFISKLLHGDIKEFILPAAPNQAFDLGE